MTNRSRTRAFARRIRRGGILKKLLILGIVAIILLIGGVALVVPMLAGNLLIPRIEAAAADSIEGSIRIDSLSVSWTGEQTARSVELLDPNGDVVAHADITIRKSLFQLLSSQNDLGTVAMSGYIEIDRPRDDAPTNLQRAVAPRRPSTPTAQPAEAVTLPPLKLNLDVSSLRFSYRVAGEPIGIDNITIAGPIDLAGRTDLAISAVPTFRGNQVTGRSIAGTLRSDALLNSADELTIAGSNLELSLDADLPGEYAGIIIEILGETATSATPSADPIRLRANIREQNGRLVPLGGTEALFLEGPLPPALIARLAPPGALRITQPGAFTLRTTRFDLPVSLLIGGLDSTDLRDSALLLALETQPVGATLTTEGLPPKVLRIEPIDLKFGSENFAQRAFVQGDIRALIDNTPAGTVLLDARIDNLLGTGGTLAPIAQVRPAGQIRLVDAPASLVDSFTAGIDALGTGFARDVFGETVNLTLDATSRADLGSSDTALESPKLTLAIDSANTTVRASAVLDGDRIEAPGEALSIRSSAGRAILARFAPQVLAEMDAESDPQRPIALTISTTDLTLIQGTNTPLDLDRLSASLRASIDRQAASTVGLDRIVLAIDAGANAPLGINAIATGNRSAGTSSATLRPYSINADLQLTGLSALAAASNPLRAPGVTADGTIIINGAPVETLEQLASLDPQTLTDILGDRLDGTITLASASNANTTTLDFETPTTTLDAGFRLDGNLLTSTRPLTIASREPQRLLDGLDLRTITINDQPALRIAGPTEFRATVEDIEIDLDRIDGASTIASGIGSASINAPGLELVGPDGQRETYTTLSLEVVRDDDLLRAEFTGRKTNAATLRPSEIRAAASLPLDQLLSSPDPIALASAAQRTLTASITAPAWLASALAPEQRSVIDAAIADAPISLSIEPAAVGSQIRVRSGQTTLDTSASIQTGTIALGETTGSINATPDRFRAVLEALDDTGEPPALGLRDAATITFRVNPISIPFGEGTPLELAGLRARAGIDGQAIITGVLERNASPRDLGVRDASATVSFNDDGPTVEAAAQAFDPVASSTLGNLIARLEPEGRFDVQLADAQPRSLDTWLAGAPAPEGPFALTFGGSLAVSARSRAVPGLPAGTDRIEVGISSPRVTTQLLADRSESRIALAEPFQVVWTLAPALFDELIAPVIADEDGSELRLREAARAAVAVRTFAIERRDGTFDPATAQIDAEFGMVNANFDAVLGENPATRLERPIELGKIQGSLRRDQASEDPIRFQFTSLDDQTDEPRFTLSGTLDTAGQSPVLSATAQGDIPTALIDVLAGQRGLLIDAIGDSVRVQASASGINAERESGTLTASIQAQRAEAATFGRFENGALVLGDGAASRSNITLSQITPDLSRRVFEPLFPLLRDFRKSPDDQPTMITVTSAGLSIPTDGDLSKLNGNINLNLGTVRFEAGELLSTVLSATANRTAGQLGQSVPPVLVRFNNGVASYDRIEIPFGDFTLRTRGTIDLVNQRMDVLVLIPLDFIGGDLKRAAERNPIIAQIAAVPFRARGPIGSAQLELDPTAIQDILPGAIEGQLNDLINQGLRDLFRR